MLEARASRPSVVEIMFVGQRREGRNKERKASGAYCKASKGAALEAIDQSEKPSEREIGGGEGGGAAQSCLGEGAGGVADDLPTVPVNHPSFRVTEKAQSWGKNAEREGSAPDSAFLLPRARTSTTCSRLKCYRASACAPIALQCPRRP